AEHVLARAPRDRPAIIAVDEDREPRAISTQALRGQVGAFAGALAELGVGPGDRVAAYLPNIPEAIVAMLAVTSLGAVWTVCGPDFGTTSVVDRFAQVQPTVLIAVDGYRFGGREHDRRQTVAQLQAQLPSVRATVLVRHLDPGREVPAGLLAFDALVAEPREPVFTRVPAEDPLWVLFSSGTTGLPKGIVQSHGGILLEHLKALGLCLDVGPEDTYFFVSSTSWMAWNFLVAGLLHGATIVVSSGSPASPGPDGVWEVAARSRATILGMGSAYVTACQKAGLEPQDAHDLSALRTVIPTGSPLPATGWRWLADRLDARIDSICGGTDVCTVFFCGSPVLPVVLGEISAPALGVAAQAWTADGARVFGEVGEFVIIRPMPSMPLRLWGDEDGQRLRASYFDEFPGIWRQGDWIKMGADGGVVVTGRSDATLNRGGVRLGSAEIYTVVEAFDAVADALVVGAELADGDYLLALFVVPAEGAVVDDALRAKLAAAIRTELSPRHVPDDIAVAPAIPRTLTGKRLEVPVKRILQGVPVAQVAAAGAVDRPDVLEWYAEYAARRVQARAAS
ncbi:MAG: acetoacetate--CoA ligase, partial [Solirubrobacterales bacterium]|nr:acetoacetate--CoA ligase [Solirubrobacterales bacterium]